MVNQLSMKDLLGYEDKTCVVTDNTSKKEKFTNISLKTAIRCCEEALKYNPNNSIALYDVGRCYMENNSFTLVDEVIKKLFALDPYSYAGHVLSGHVYLIKGMLKESYDSFIRAYYRAEYKDRYLVYGIALFYEAVGDFKSARPWLVFLNRLGVEDYKTYELLFRTAVCHKEIKLLYDATNTFRVIIYNPIYDNYDFNVQIQMAHIHEMEGLYDKAIEGLEFVLRKSSIHHFIASRLYAWIKYKTKDFEGFKKIYRESKRLKEDPYILYLIGRVKVLEGKYLGALKKFVAASQMDNMGGMVLNSLGCTYMHIKDYNSAEKAFLEASKAGPNDPIITKNLEQAKIAALGSRRTSQSDNFFKPDIKEITPDISKTRYMASYIFLGGPLYKPKYVDFGDALPFVVSRIENLRN